MSIEAEQSDRIRSICKKILHFSKKAINLRMQVGLASLPTA